MRRSTAPPEMNPTTPPSPLSIGPPQREIQRKSSAEAVEEIIRTPSSIPMVPTSTTETIIGRHLCILAEYLKPRPAHPSPFKVIAIDGYDRNAVHGMIGHLQYRITRDLHYTVRVISEDSFYPPNDQPTELSHFIRQIQSWGAMWEMILHAPSIGPSPIQPICPVIYIIPLSPLMATMRAMRQTVDSSDTWRWLSSHWRNSWRSDVTINIQDIADTSFQNDVLRIQINGMKTLVVTKEGQIGLNITPQQLRRVIFEVEEWIRW